jgi:hypothetical protein
MKILAELARGGVKLSVMLELDRFLGGLALEFIWHRLTRPHASPAKNEKSELLDI